MTTSSKYYSIVVGLLLTILQLEVDALKSSDKCKPLRTLKYELYGTKTLYSDARRYLSTEDSDDLPKSFDDDSLEEEHNDLVKKSCKPVAFYFFGRHSARFPDGEDADLYTKHMNEIQSMLRNNLNDSKCPEKSMEILNWKPKLQFRYDNLITHLGGIEQRDIAQRFKSIYPEFFDAKKSDIKIGVTTKLRTAQTAVEFLKQVENLKLDGCEDVSPNLDIEHPEYSTDKLRSNKCYEDVMQKYTRDYLEFHEECKNIMGGKSKTKYPMVERVRDPKVVKDVIDNISERLGLDKDKSPINPDILDSIFDNCRFENAFLNDSVWCKLFDKRDMKVMEYIEDVNTYYKGGYGIDSKATQSCPLVKDLLEEFTSIAEGSDPSKRKSVFYFSHASPMKKLLATFGIFKDDESFAESAIENFERSLKIPKRRNWRISLITPFSANMAFIMYRCQKPGKEAKYKILATVTEQPVKLGGCKDTDCSSEKFFKTYEPLKTCDMKDICG